MTKLSTEAIDILGRAKRLAISVSVHHDRIYLPVPISEIERHRRDALGREIGRCLEAENIIQTCTYAGLYYGDRLYDPAACRDTWTTDLTFMPTRDHKRLSIAVQMLHDQLKALNKP